MMYRSVRFCSAELVIYGGMSTSSFLYIPKLWFVRGCSFTPTALGFNWLRIGIRLMIPNYISEYKLRKDVERYCVQHNITGAHKDILTLKEKIHIRMIVSRIKYNNSKMLGADGWAIGLFRVWTPFLRKIKKGQ